MILLIGLSHKSMSQDTIFLTQQRQYIVKVIEVEDQKVKYRKFENLEGPIYSVNKNEIVAIRYQNGTVDTFNSSSSSIVERVVTKENFLTWIKGPNIAVYVGSNDSASIIHAKKALQFVTSWNIVDDPSKSQIIIRFDFVSIGMGIRKEKQSFSIPKQTIYFSKLKQ
jgi:hypothetical protein